MHLIVLEQEPSSLRGGQERVLFDFCRGLAQRGPSISLLYTKEGNLLEKYQEFCDRVEKVNRFIIYRPERIFSFLTDIQKATRKIPIIENSIVLTNQYQDTLFGYALALSKNLPLVCYLHLPPPAAQLAQWQWNMGMKGLRHFIALSNIRYQWSIGRKRVKHFIAVSNQTKSDWVTIGYNKHMIDVVYNGTDLKVYQPSSDFPLTRKEWNISEDIRVISYVGRLDKEKGLETLIKAFALLLKNNANARLLIAGKSVLQGEEYKKSLERLSTDLGLEKYVNFLGHVVNTTSIYQVSDVTVLPSLGSEPFGRSITESMACGTPVVASRTGGIPEILTGEFQKGVFEPGNERDLSDTLNRIMNWRDTDPQLGERYREHILSKFSLETMVDGIEKVLEQRFNSSFG
ncbi:MAG TPA: glycosyltransferase family 4 protein [Coleofasciculaceae cyanobacterium]|jgi:glycosyltransferase involved in cell wall biosynthesis